MISDEQIVKPSFIKCIFVFAPLAMFYIWKTELLRKRSLSSMEKMIAYLHSSAIPHYSACDVTFCPRSLLAGLVA